jgi:hypothetical protein
LEQQKRIQLEIGLVMLGGSSTMLMEMFRRKIEAQLCTILQFQDFTIVDVLALWSFDLHEFRLNLD